MDTDEVVVDLRPGSTDPANPTIITSVANATIVLVSTDNANVYYKIGDNFNPGDSLELYNTNAFGVAGTISITTELGNTFGGPGSGGSMHLRKLSDARVNPGIWGTWGILGGGSIV